LGRRCVMVVGDVASPADIQALAARGRHRGRLSGLGGGRARQRAHHDA
jgi:hypothetical protein